MRDSLSWASSTSAMSFGENCSVSNVEPARQDRRQAQRRHAGRHPLRLQVGGLFGGQLVGVLQHGVGDAAGGGHVRRVAGQHRRRRPAGRGRPRAGRGRGRRRRGRLVADVEHVGGDVGLADRVAAASVRRTRRSTSHGGTTWNRAGNPFAVAGGGQHERFAAAGSPRTAVWRTPPTTCTGRGPGCSTSPPAALGDAPTRYGRHRRQQRRVQVEAGPGGVGQRLRRCPYQFGVAHSAGQPDHGDGADDRRRATGRRAVVDEHDPVRVARGRTRWRRPSPAD